MKIRGLIFSKSTNRPYKCHTALKSWWFRDNDRRNRSFGPEITLPGRCVHSHRGSKEVGNMLYRCSLICIFQKCQVCHDLMSSFWKFSKKCPKMHIFYELNNSKSCHQNWKNLTVLENIEKITSGKHISNILRQPVRTLRQPQCN